ncbi:MAG: hypothetical protein VB138_15175, partial [Burkholderia sp.]
MHEKDDYPDPEDMRATPGQTQADRRRIKELEREVQRTDRALAETTALLGLSKKLVAIFRKRSIGTALRACARVCKTWYRCSAA